MIGKQISSVNPSSRQIWSADRITWKMYNLVAVTLATKGLRQFLILMTEFRSRWYFLMLEPEAYLKNS